MMTAVVAVVAGVEEDRFMKDLFRFCTFLFLLQFASLALSDESCSWRDPKLRFADGIESCLKKETPLFNISGLIENDSRTYYEVARGSRMYSMAVVKDQESCPFATGTAWDWNPTENPLKAIEYCEKKFPESLKRTCKCEIIVDFWETPFTSEQFRTKVARLVGQHLAGGAPLGVSGATELASSSVPSVDKSSGAAGMPADSRSRPPGPSESTIAPNAAIKPTTLKPQQSASLSERRLALVIGNGSYRSSPLKNPRNDVQAMTTALTRAGFEVMAHNDLDFRAMRNAIREFGDKLTRYDVGLFYYSGHGVQVEGNNYLIPVDSDIRRVDEITTSSLNANFVLAKMESAQNKLNLVVLDACRDSPLGSMSRGMTRGLSSMDAAKGTMIAFSTAPGEVALDGEGDNSPYTKHLASAIQKEGLLLEQVFKEVRRNVVAETQGKQVPWENSSVMGDFFFVR